MMKKITKYYIITSITLVIITFLGCNLQDTLDDFNTVISLDIIKNKKEVFFVNANASGKVPENIEISFSGDIKNDIFSAVGNKISKLDNNGIVFGLKNTALAASTAPINTTMTVKAPGFFNREVPITFSGGELETLSVTLLEKDNLPSSIQFVEKTVTVSNGEFTDDVNIVVDDPNSDTNLLNVKIQKGTQLFDENKNRINPDDVNVTIETYDTSTNSLKNDGYNPIQDINPDVFKLRNNPDQKMVPILVFRTRVEANGKEVLFNKPIHYAIRTNGFKSSKTSLITKGNLPKSRTFWGISFCDSNCGNLPPGLYGGVAEGGIDVCNGGGCEGFDKDGYFYIPDENTKPQTLIDPPSAVFVAGFPASTCNVDIELKNTHIATKYEIQVSSDNDSEFLDSYGIIDIGYNESFKSSAVESGKLSFNKVPSNARLKIIAKFFDGTEKVVHDQTYNNCSMNNKVIDVSVLEQPSQSVDQDCIILI